MIYTAGHEGSVELSEPQVEVLSESGFDLESGEFWGGTAAQILLALAGIRGGKTEIGGLVTILRAIHVPTAEDECHAIVSPTFPMSAIGPEPKLRKLLFDSHLFPLSPLVRQRRSERAYFVKNKDGGLSKIRIFSGDDPNRWRGDKWRSAWLDEAARLTSEGWTIAQGRLADTAGPALITTTPDGQNWVADLADEASEPEERVGYLYRRSTSGEVVLVKWRSLDNPFLSSKARGRFDALRGRMDEDTAAQELDAEIVARSGRVYKSFVPAVHVLDRAPPPGDFPIYVGQDFNVARMFSAFIYEWQAPDGKRGHVFDELEIRQADTYVLARALDRWCGEHRIEKARIRIFADAAGRARSTKAQGEVAKSDFEILERAGYRIAAPRRNPRVRDRVNAVNGMLTHNRLTLARRCALLRKALSEQMYDEFGEPEKDGVKDNRTDALGYVVWGRFPLARPSAMIETNEPAKRERSEWLS